MRRILLSLVLGVLGAGCAMARSNVNEPLEPGELAKLQLGMSAHDVVELLGAPVDVVQLGRRSAYRYDFTSTKRAGLFLIVVLFYNEDTRSDRLWVFFDETEKLTHVGTTLQGDDNEYAMPWEDLHD